MADLALPAEQVFSQVGRRVLSGVSCTEGTDLDSEGFDGLARTFGDLGQDPARDRERFDTLSRLVAAKGSRRMALAGLTAAVLQGQEPQPTAVQCRS